MLTAMVLGGTRPGVSYMCQMCAEIPGVVVVRSLEQLPKLHNLGRVLNAFSPQLVVLEACDDEPWMELAQEMLDHHPDIPLIAYSMAKNHAAVAGGLGLLTLEVPFSGEEFQDALFRSLSRSPTGNNCRVITFLPAKGGSGATVLALAAATTVAQRLRKRVLFLEYDVHSGPVGVYLNLLQPRHSIMSVLDDPHALDRHPLSELATKSNGMDVLPSIGLRRTQRLSAWGCQRLLSRARSMYDYVFCDLPEGMDDALDPVLRGADQVVIATTSCAPAMFLAERRLTSLSQLGIPDTKISVVLNRVRKGDPVVNTIKRRPVSASVPHRPMLLDAPSFDLNSIIGNGLEPAISRVAEICAGAVISKQRPLRGLSLASLWNAATLNMGRSRSEGARG